MPPSTVFVVELSAVASSTPSNVSSSAKSNPARRRANTRPVFGERVMFVTDGYGGLCPRSTRIDFDIEPFARVEKRSQRIRLAASQVHVHAAVVA